MKRPINSGRTTVLRMVKTRRSVETTYNKQQRPSLVLLFDVFVGTGLFDQIDIDT